MQCVLSSCEIPSVPAALAITDELVLTLAVVLVPAFLALDPHFVGAGGAALPLTEVLPITIARFGVATILAMSIIGGAAFLALQLPSITVAKHGVGALKLDAVAIVTLITPTALTLANVLPRSFAVAVRISALTPD